VLGEPAPWFFALLDQAMKIMAEERIVDINTAMMPHVSEDVRRKTVDDLTRSSRDMIDMLPDNYQGRASDEEISQVLGA